MTAREWILMFMGAVAGFDVCAFWWLYTLDRERQRWERDRWPDRIR